MNLSSVLIITTLITGAGEISKNEKGFNEMSLKFDEVEHQTVVDSEYVASMKQCKEIIFSRGISEIFENNGKGKVVYGQGKFIYFTYDSFDAVNFKERSFGDAVESKRGKMMYIGEFEKSVEIKYANYYGATDKKKVMKCVEVKK